MPSPVRAVLTAVSRATDAPSYSRFQYTPLAPVSAATSRTTSSESPRRSTSDAPRAARSAAKDRKDLSNHHADAAPIGRGGPAGSCTNSATTGAPDATASVRAGLSARRRSRRNQTMTGGGEARDVRGDFGGKRDPP